DQLFVDAVAAQVEINELGTRLAKLSDGDAVFEGRSKPKDRQRAEDKVVKYRGVVCRLKDLAAGRVSYQRLSDLYAALETLRQASGIEIVEYEDRFRAPQPSGYRDIQLMLRTSAGHLAEFRLELATLNEVAVWEHALYEVKRDLEAVAAQQARSLSPMELAIRSGILQQERHYFWRALQSARGGGTST
ncbi:MAG TPA: hypothetical protein VFY84_10005, partial [Jiangellales bacterium]|nr:hypothetical protein [Jiangellales bacterium]